MVWEIDQFFLSKQAHGFPDQFPWWRQHACIPPWLRISIEASLILCTFADYWWFYAGFTLGVLALDRGGFHRDAHEIKFKEALGRSVAWIGPALRFCFGDWQYAQGKLPTDPASSRRA